MVWTIPLQVLTAMITFRWDGNEIFSLGGGNDYVELWDGGNDIVHLGADVIWPDGWYYQHV